MGKPLMIREEDDQRIEKLRKTLGIPTKVQVLRSALDLLEQAAERQTRILRWKKAAKAAASSSKAVLNDFRANSRIRRDE